MATLCKTREFERLRDSFYNDPNFEQWLKANIEEIEETLRDKDEVALNVNVLYEIMTCSITEVEQYAGRLRDSEGKQRMIIHLVDDDPNCQSHWSDCRKWYVSRKGDIIHFFKEFPQYKSILNGDPPENEQSTEPGYKRLAVRKA